MDPRWERAVGWYLSLESGRRKVEYTATIRLILQELQEQADLPSLQARYDGGLEWAEALARAGFPQTPALWARQRTADVAFGIRARQLQGHWPPRG